MGGVYIVTILTDIIDGLAGGLDTLRSMFSEGMMSMMHEGSRRCKPTGQKCDYVERKQYDRTFTNDSGLPLEVDERTDSSSSLGGTQ